MPPVPAVMAPSYSVMGTMHMCVRVVMMVMVTMMGGMRGQRNGRDREEHSDSQIHFFFLFADLDAFRRIFTYQLQP